MLKYVALFTCAPAVALQSHRIPISRRAITSALMTASLMSERAADVATLLGEHRELFASCKAPSGLLYDDMFVLGHLVEAADVVEASESIKACLAWREGQGSNIVRAAREAVQTATGAGGWDNDAVFMRAPHAEAIAPFISPAGTQFRTLVR